MWKTQRGRLFITHRHLRSWANSSYSEPAIPCCPGLSDDSSGRICAPVSSEPLKSAATVWPDLACCDQNLFLMYTKIFLHRLHALVLKSSTLHSCQAQRWISHHMSRIWMLLWPFWHLASHQKPGYYPQTGQDHTRSYSTCSQAVTWCEPAVASVSAAPKM